MSTDEKKFGDSWNFQTEEQRGKMMEPLTSENCWEKLILIRTICNITRRDLAKVFGCSESTLARIERNITKPTELFMNMLAALVLIGYYKYSKLSNTEKENLSEIISTSGGAVSGIGASIAAVAAAGAVPGLSAAGITSGLAAIGGGMIGGMAVVATLPLATAAAGYGLVKGIKAICENNRLSCTTIDDKFEIRATALESDDDSKS